MTNNIDKLKELYSKAGKHSNYQVLPTKLKNYIDTFELSLKSHYDLERLHYILSLINPNNKRILDVGGNTGLFSFELLDAGADHVCLYEGNKIYAQFVETASNLMGYGNRMKVIKEYLTFTNELIFESYDVTLLLNVLHHVGDDYGNKKLSIKQAKIEMLRSLNYLADKTMYLILQIGFCWKGNRNLLFFQRGTKKEMIDFIISGTHKKWITEQIGIPEECDGQVVYKKPDSNNITRNDRIGEFLNRPIFFMKSKLIN